MSDEGYPVNAEALKPSKLLRLDAATFIHLLHRSNETCFRLMAHMSRRLRWQLNEIDRLTLHTASFRFINFLLDPPPKCRGDEGEIRLNMPKHILASRLSIKPETFSRILSRLSDEGLIRTQRDAVHLLDEQGLRDRLQTLLGGSFPDAPTAGETIIEDVWRFCDRNPQVDDITLVCFGRSR